MIEYRANTRIADGMAISRPREEALAIPRRVFWAYFCGAAHIAAGLGVLVATLPRLAAILEAAMITGFTVLVWVPALFTAPTDVGRWTETMISWIIGAGAWVVADSYRRAPWMHAQTAA